jgi:phosphatidylglycerophosphate synthase
MAHWRRLHGDLRPSGLVRAWVHGMHVLAATPVVRPIPPDVLSAAGVAVAGAAIAAAAGGGRWPLLAALLVVLVGILDGLDGAVALVTGRVRPLGAVIDAMCDRLADLALVAVLLALGAPAGWCAAAAGSVLLHEYLRSRAQAAGMSGIGALTVAERPTRLALVAVACVGAGSWPAGTPGTGWDWATVSAVAWVAVGAVGLAQLCVGVARTLPAARPAGSRPRSGGPDEIGDDAG